MFAKVDWDSLKADFASTDWKHLFQDNDPDGSVRIVCNYIELAAFAASHEGLFRRESVATLGWMPIALPPCKLSVLLRGQMNSAQKNWNATVS